MGWELGTWIPQIRLVLASSLSRVWTPCRLLQGTGCALLSDTSGLGKSDTSSGRNVGYGIDTRPQGRRKGELAEVTYPDDLG